MPRLQGAVYIENCYGDDYCYIPVSYAYISDSSLSQSDKQDQISEFMKTTSFKMPWQRVVV